MPALAERPLSQLLSLRTPVCGNPPSTRRPERELQKGKREREVGLKMGVDAGKTWPCMAAHGAKYIWRGGGGGGYVHGKRANNLKHGNIELEN